MKQIRIDESSAFFQEAECVRLGAFDPGDAVEWSLLKRRQEEGYGVYDAYVENATVVGITYRCYYPDVTYLLYLAVRKDLRCRGFGQEILKIVMEQEKAPMMLDVESVLETQKEDIQLRVRRKKFYLRNGWQDTGHVLRDDGGYYDILATDGLARDQEFLDAMVKLSYDRFHPYFVRKEDVT